MGGRIWVFGASSGLGLAIARRCRGRGDEVIGFSRGAPPADAVTRHCAVDVCDTSALETLVRQECSAGAPEIVFYCAAIAWQGPLLEQDLGALRREMETNYFGFVALARALAGARTGAHVRLVASGSTLGYIGCPSLDNYSASKAALICFSRSARAELEPLGVDILILSPPHMENGADLRGPQPFSLDWAAKRMISEAERGRAERLLGFSNRMLLGLSRLVPTRAQAIMDSIGRDALKRLEGRTGLVRKG